MATFYYSEINGNMDRIKINEYNSANKQDIHKTLQMNFQEWISVAISGRPGYLCLFSKLCLFCCVHNSTTSTVAYYNDIHRFIYLWSVYDYQSRGFMWIIMYY